MKQNILLAVASTGLCVLLGIFILNRVLPSALAPQGSQFESVAEFRAQLAQRDDRDIKADSSVSFRSIVESHPSDMVLYTLKPGLDVKFQGVPLKTNSFGMRNRELPMDKPKGVLRIALLGDSFAFGWGVEQDSTFAIILEQELNKMLGDTANTRVEVLNFGVPGYSTFQQVTAFNEKGMQFEPDIVLVFFVDNDFGLPFLIKRFDGSDALHSASRFEKFRRVEKEQETITRQRKFLGNINPNRHLAALADELSKRSVPLLISINPRKSIDYDIKRLYVLRHHDNVHYVSIREPYSAFIREHKLSREDVTLKGDSHPNAYRHRIYGELLARGVQPFVQNALSLAPCSQNAQPTSSCLAP